ncbi:deoxyribonuclease IV [Buchnera aphidicola str. APS (Acyrthosiphon pisum)]|uniref:Probable endonuclease 4 n=3 Tax=Buchnera aphidicola TaxID=9 RepID=END4_BUCAI|nr:deoxyribonuclease IV [Buchnera aphidicola]B8D742.1 RecName: Full=Probable endonuclease 4; AltName: Full=Endodeoxyribonuclease IV; AltName: Full=Endonuclease IV [Buchnera aphidicola str. Tuc7 (Acyrthosiphon pisum)]B8D8T8.1 RecName: Full=Probable endonuclease 4; AltName: Full=Endodeoxyribonuclease IV; AltName: Full=Endonuclease IV [Buchnera aphidicola str. 5A (Acyrthosiphon pisum)]P57237.1 RecName: Full=Probable endonuclease 4; AltName: Full=Endodeoxyribonuclease IV; AltName: Full=Endonuclease 
MNYIGAHVSSSGGLEKTVLRAIQIKATAFSFFTKNQRQWFSPPLIQKKIDQFKAMCIKYSFQPQQILPHSSYLINLGHPIDELLRKSRKSFIDEMIRCSQLGLIFLNFHPGSHLNKITENACLLRVSDSINIALEKTQNVIAVIENTAGQGTNIGYCFEHLSEIIKNIDDKSRVGVCIDTCHLFASGYDLRTKKDCENTFEKFNSLIGLKYLKGIHLNDSKKKINSRVDRHESLGLGEIGTAAFTWIIKNENFSNIPIILETANPMIWEEEIDWLRSQKKL